MNIGVVLLPPDDAAPVCDMIRRFGATCLHSADPGVLSGADGLIIGGTATTADAMAELESLRCASWIRALDRPVLGINMGMQLLVEQGTFGETHLGVLPGRCASLSECSCVTPNLGWHPVEKLADHPLLNGITRDDLFYFVHETIIGLGPFTLASSTCGTVFSAAVAKDHIMGVQFALEKSGRAGSLVLQNFLALAKAGGAGHAGLGERHAGLGAR